LQQRPQQLGSRWRDHALEYQPREKTSSSRGASGWC